MGTLNKNPAYEADDIICLSSDSENEEQSERVGLPSKQSFTGSSSSVSGQPDVKVETNNNASDRETTSTSQTNSAMGNSRVPSQATTVSNAFSELLERSQSDAQIVANFPFSIFGAENTGLPIEDRMTAFINNVQSMADEKLKLAEAEEQAKRKLEEAKSQLDTASQEIINLQDNLHLSRSKIHEQSDSLNQLKSTVENLKKHESTTKGKLKGITSTLTKLQEKMIQVLEETEVEAISEIFSGSDSDMEPRQALPATDSDEVVGTLNEAILKENMDLFERDFEAKFLKVEEQDKEIKDELQRTSEMLQRMHAALLEQLPTHISPQSVSPQLHESMEVEEQQEIEDISLSAYNSTRAGGGSMNPMAKKVSIQEDSNFQHSLMHARDPKRKHACVCGMRYGTKYSIDRHLRKESGRNHFACNLCSESYFELSSLRKHYETAHDLHYPAKIAGCSGCGHVFSSFTDLSKHRRRCAARSSTLEHSCLQ